MRIGKKIGGGFLSVLILTMILGLWAVFAMHSGSKVAEEIANDRLPRFIGWSEAQNDLLEAAYFARAYFEGGDEENIKKTYGYLKSLGERLEDIKKLNAIIRYENTAKALEKGDRELARYIKLIQQNQDIYMDSEKLVGQMMKAADQFQARFSQMVATVGATLASYIESGNANAASRYARNLLALDDLRGKVNAIWQDIMYAERNNDIAALADAQKRLKNLEAEAGKLNESLLRPEDHEMFAKTHEAYLAFSSCAAAVAKSLQDLSEAGKVRYAQFRAMYQDTINMVNLTTSNTRKFSRHAEDALASSTTIVSIILCIVLALGVAVAIFITRGIVRPLSATQLFAEDVAAGNLQRELDVRGDDETGKLADALRAMLVSLKQNIDDARRKSEEAARATEEATAATARAEEAARHAENAKREGMLAAAGQLEGMVEIISSASTQLTAQVEQSDNVAAESAQRLQEAATAMNEMNATVQEVARNAGTASEASSETRRKAEAGQQIVQQVVRSMDEVQATSLQLKSDMSQLNDRAQDINRIMGVISDIADQTNLLALNAAIEAARAGEAGRGFAVVADEVRKLAEKTMSSTLDVSNAIRAIQESTGKSMQAMDSAAARIGQATELANQSGSALEEIVATVQATSDQVQAIAAASEEQSAASEQINKSITEINDMTNLTSQAMNGAAQAVSDLANQTHKLAGLITEMKNA